MGAMTKVRVCLPVDRVSPSPTRMARSAMSQAKNWLRITAAGWVQTTWTSG